MTAELPHGGIPLQYLNVLAIGELFAKKSHRPLLLVLELCNDLSAAGCFFLKAVSRNGAACQVGMFMQKSPSSFPNSHMVFQERQY